MKKLMLFLLCGAVLLMITGPVAAAELTKMSTAWCDESPGFNIWYAKKMGWDKEEGLDIQMLLFSSGPAMVEALPSKEWVIGSPGAGGQLTGAIRYNVSVIAPTISEGEMHGLYLRPGHPATKVKGYNPKYPNVYGSPETVKGMKILYTTQTTVHFMIGKWLSILGLTFDDVTLVNMDQASAIPAFSKGIGDAVCLWSPFIFSAERNGWFKAASGTDLDCITVAAYVGDKEWCDAHPDLVAKFLRVHYRTTNMLREEGLTPRIIAEYQEYMRDFCGIKMNAEEAAKDLEIHPRWTYAETLPLVTDGPDGSCKSEQWQNEIADFFASIKRFTPEEVAELKKKHVTTDKFLKLVQLPIPDWRK